MTGLESLNKRLQYYGGITATSRLEKDKLNSLKDALHNSYQSETVILKDSKEFKCLINQDKLNMDYDRKIISIPYYDRCLNSTEKENEKIDLKTGDVFTWKETNTHWMVYLQHIEETAYFNADILKCDQEVQVNDIPYWVYLRGPTENSIIWNQKNGIEWNDLNYSLVMFITKDDNTANFFYRFQKIKIKDPGSQEEKTWKITGKNLYYGDNMIQVFLDEDFENTLEEQAKEEQDALTPELPPIDKEKPHIEGPIDVCKYDIVKYTACNFTEPGSWYLIEDDKTLKINNTSSEFTLEIVKSKGNFSVQYKTASEDAQLIVTINAF